MIFGIITASFIHIPVLVSLIIFGCILAFLLILNRFYSYRLTAAFGLGIHLLFFILGITGYTYHNQKPVFYDDGDFFATVLEAPVEKANSYKSVLKLGAVHIEDNVFQSGETLVAYFEKNDSVQTLNPGDIIFFKNPPRVVENRKNPYEFDNKGYLERQKIYRQVYLPVPDWTATTLKHPFSLKILAEKTRMKLMDIYREQKLGKNELDILSALTLGYKRELDPETKRVFSSAGAMHVLAVSGLHVGIIFWLLLKILGFLRKRNSGRILFVFIVISTLWFFAFLTGLSPSVSRAATMFTFVVVGTNINRRVNIYNSLAGSALFLLLINPNNLFEVGFQLSYSAVFGIVFLQPKFEKLATIKNKFLNFFWQLLTVSVAAQAATFPISILYFNQFPTYFWISNLFVIPAVMGLIPLGFSLLLFHGVPVLGVAISIVTGFIIKNLYLLLKFIEDLPFSVQEISISNLEFIFILGILISLLLLIDSYRIKYLKSSLIFILLLTGFSLATKIASLNQKEIIIYNDDDIIVHLIAGKNNYVISEHQLNENDYSFNLVKNTIKKLDLADPVLLTFNNSYSDNIVIIDNNLVLFEGQTLLLDRNTAGVGNKIMPDILVSSRDICNIPRSGLSAGIIVSGSKYSPETKTGVPSVHYLKESGAYLKKW